MKIVVLYDSYFGNTEKIAQTIGQSFDNTHQVKVLKVNTMTLDQLKGVDVFIVGSPTRAFRPTPLITSFLNSIPKDGLKDTKVVAFDTGVAPLDIKSTFLRFIVKKAGYAAKPIANLLVQKGGTLLVPPTGFFVTGNEGPLKDGEIERAAFLIKLE